jgi:hypothetical protein
VNDQFVQLRAALQGDFQYEVDAARGNVINALGLSMTEVAEELVGKLRTDVERSGMANATRLKTAAWRSKVYGAGTSLDPAAWVFSKLPLIIQAFENGLTIRARGGKGLLIPNPDVWGGRARLGRGKSLGGLWALATQRFGDLHVVKRPGKTTLVVAQVREGTGTRGGFRKASATALKRGAAGKASGLVSVVVFVIVKDAKLPRLLKGDTIRARAQRDAPARMDQLFQKYFVAYDGAGPRQITSQRPAAAWGRWTDGPSSTW